MSMEAEKSVIGSVLMDSMVIDKVHWLEPRDFKDPAHSLIWSAIKHMYKKDQKIDLVTLTTQLDEYKRLNEIGGVLYLRELLNTVITTANVEYHANIVRRNAIKRRATDIGHQIAALSEKPYEDLEQMFQEVERLAGSIRPESQTDLIHLENAEDEYFDYLDQEDDFIKTGFKNFDEWIGGLGRGWLYVLAARPSVGKTAKMLQMLRGIASQGKGQCLVWSQEMKRTALINRMMASLTGIHMNTFRLKKLTPHEKKIAREVYRKEIAPLPIRIADSKNVTIEEIAATARQAKRENGQIAAIFVDYLGIMNIPQPPGMSRQQAIGQVTQAAKRLAMELDCVFVLLAQMNREGKKAIEPSLEHLRESGDIEQDADVVEFLWEDPEDTDPGPDALGAKVIQSIIAKGRDVGVNRFRYGFFGAYQHFVDLPKLDEE